MLCDMTKDASYKAHALAAFADARKWDVEARRITHRDYPDKRYRPAGWTVIAQRSAEIVTATWLTR
jgi:hypothetical protein